MNGEKLGTAAMITAISSTLFAGSLCAAPLQPVNHIEWMQSKNYIAGTKDNLALGRPITIAEAVVMLARVQNKEQDVVAGDPVINHWGAKALTWAKQQSIVNAEQWKELHKPANAKILQHIAYKAGLTLNVTGDTITRGQFFVALGDAITTHVTIGHTNDTHGHMLENAKEGEIGYAKLATLMKELREENANTMIIDGGDMIQGSLHVNQSKGEAATQLANALGYDAMTSGNHEYDFRYEHLMKLTKMFNFPVLAANVFDKQGNPPLQPYVTKRFANKTFAILGLVTKDTPTLTHPDYVKDLTFKDPIEVAQEWVPKLRKKADHIIVLSHTGLEYDRELAQQVPGIDIIIGGHSHTPVHKPEFINGTYIVQAWEYAKALGRIDLFYHGKDLVHFSGGLLTYDKMTQPDPKVVSIIESLQRETETLLSDKIATVTVNIDEDRKKIRKQETMMGNLVADAMMEGASNILGSAPDIALINAGYIRASFMKGDITKRNLYDALPFPNTLVVVEITGNELKAALENGVSKIDRGSGRFPQIAGMTFSFDIKKLKGNRVIDIKVGGNTLVADKMYRVATADFLITGGDGYTTFKDKKTVKTGMMIHEIVEQYMKEKKEIALKIEQRIKQLE